MAVAALHSQPIPVVQREKNRCVIRSVREHSHMHGISTSGENMASITERKREDSPSNWQVMVRLAGSKPVIKTFVLRSDAEDFARELEKKIRAKRRLSKPERTPIALE